MAPRGDQEEAMETQLLQYISMFDIQRVSRGYWKIEGTEEIIAMGLVDFHSWDLCSSINDICFLDMPVFDTCWQHVHN